jgi:hypothetical protein
MLVSFGALSAPLSAPKVDPGKYLRSPWMAAEKYGTCGVNVKVRRSFTNARLSKGMAIGVPELRKPSSLFQMGYVSPSVRSGYRSIKYRSKRACCALLQSRLSGDRSHAATSRDEAIRLAKTSSRRRSCSICLASSPKKLGLGTSTVTNGSG